MLKVYAQSVYILFLKEQSLRIPLRYENYTSDDTLRVDGTL